MMQANEQFQCLNLLDYLSDLFTVTTAESFTPGQVLIVLNAVKNDPEMFDPDVVIAQEQATAHL